MFVPSETLAHRQPPSADELLAAMAEALDVPANRLRRPIVLVAPAALHDQVHQAVTEDRWSPTLKEQYQAIRGTDGRIDFVLRR
ncbi:hypothetical protein [Streptomyces noursei]